MKKYKITVNGQTYEVEVEDISKDAPTFTEVKTTPSTVEPKPQQPQQPQQPQPKQDTAPKPKTQNQAGSQKITSPMPGTIMSIKSKPGDKVQKGHVIMILEAMKMENEIIAPEDGVIASIDTSEGASVDTGDILATLS